MMTKILAVLFGVFVSTVAFSAPISSTAHAVVTNGGDPTLFGMTQRFAYFVITLVVAPLLVLAVMWLIRWWKRGSGSVEDCMPGSPGYEANKEERLKEARRQFEERQAQERRFKTI